MKTIEVNGTSRNDDIFVFDGFGAVTSRKGDDKITFASLDNCRIDGGFGFDEFDFYITSAQTLRINEISGDKTVIKIGTGDDVQKIVLLDIEEINYTIEKGTLEF